MGKDKRKKTENDLDERFQWVEGLDPDHIFDDEKEMIAQLREAIPQLVDESDKFVATFLFARRHDLKETITLLKEFYKKKEEYARLWEGYHHPSFKFTKQLQEDPNSIIVLLPIGYRDNKGRMLRMMVIGEAFTPNLDTIYTMMFWQLYYMVAVEPLNAWRNGIVSLMDAGGLSLGLITNPGPGKAVVKASQHTFPFRMRSMLVVNGGTLLSVFFATVRLLLPKKIVKRFAVISDINQLKEYIPAQYLVPRFGGNASPFEREDFIKQVAETEERLFVQGIWKTPSQ